MHLCTRAFACALARSPACMHAYLRMYAYVRECMRASLYGDILLRLNVSVQVSAYIKTCAQRTDQLENWHSIACVRFH